MRAFLPVMHTLDGFKITMFHDEVSQDFNQRMMMMMMMIETRINLLVVLFWFCKYLFPFGTTPSHWSES